MRTGALAAALAAAALLPPGPPGVGVAVVAALVALTVAAAVPRWLDLALFGLPALVLVSMAVIRDAGWVVAADVALAIVLAAIAIGGVTATALVRPFVALRSAPALVPSPGPRALPALRGVLAGGLLVIPFAALFWTADAAFASAGRAIPVPGLGSLPAQVATFGLVLAGTIGLAGAPAVSITGPSLGLTRRCLPEWAVPLAALDLLFLGFVAVQAHVLFAGHDYVLRTTGLTYSEYARTGFWQLIGAAFLTLVVIAAAFGIAGRAHRASGVSSRACWCSSGFRRCSWSLRRCTGCGRTNPPSACRGCGSRQRRWRCGSGPSCSSSPWQRQSSASVGTSPGSCSW